MRSQNKYICWDIDPWDSDVPTIVMISPVGKSENTSKVSLFFSFKFKQHTCHKNPFACFSTLLFPQIFPPISIKIHINWFPFPQFQPRPTPLVSWIFLYKTWKLASRIRRKVVLMPLPVFLTITPYSSSSNSLASLKNVDRTFP